MDGRKVVKYTLKPGESVKAGDVEIELTKHRQGTPSKGAVAEILIHAPDDLLIHRVKKRGDGLRENDFNKSLPRPSTPRANPLFPLKTQLEFRRVLTVVKAD